MLSGGTCVLNGGQHAERLPVQRRELVLALCSTEAAMPVAQEEHFN